MHFDVEVALLVQYANRFVVTFCRVRTVRARPCAHATTRFAPDHELRKRKVKSSKKIQNPRWPIFIPTSTLHPFPSPIIDQKRTTGPARACKVLRGVANVLFLRRLRTL
jgi:hypothetical protein